MNAASVLFVDNPVGTGYSYTDSYGDLTKDVAMVASDMMVLLQHFFSKKPEFQVTRIPTRYHMQCKQYSMNTQLYPAHMSWCDMLGNPIRLSQIILVRISMTLSPSDVSSLLYRLSLSTYFPSLMAERWQLPFHWSSPRYISVIFNLVTEKRVFFNTLDG